MIWFRPELRVLFVCTANICRSPLAEGLLRHRLRAMDLAGRVQVRSAGTGVGQRGRRPDPRVEQLAAEAGVSLGRIRSRMLTPQLIRRSDYVLVMEREHLETVERLCPDLHAEAGNSAVKVSLLGRYSLGQGALQEVDIPNIPDPYFGNLQSFYDVYEMIDLALDGVLLCIEAQLKKFQDT